MEVANPYIHGTPLYLAATIAPLRPGQKERPANAPARNWPGRQYTPNGKRYALTPVSSALTCQSRRAASRSYDRGADLIGLQSWKYVPVTPSTSGDEAR